MATKSDFHYYNTVKESHRIKIHNLRYFPTYLGIGLLWLVSHLPYSLQLKIGTALGLLLLRFAKTRRQIADINLQLCFPEKTPQERKALLREIFISHGIGFIEMGLAWWHKPEKLKQLVKIEGLENFELACKQNKGVILIGAHFTTLDLAGTLLRQYIDVDPMYRKAKNPVFEKFMKKGREKHFTNLIERSDIRSVLKTLKSGRTIWYAPDQDYGTKRSVFAPFFGVPAASIKATSRFAQMNSSPLIMFSHYRNSNGRGYTLQLGPVLEGYPTGDDIRDAALINKLLEDAIRAHPEQYMWMHKRFKSRPADMPSLYPPRTRKRKRSRHINHKRK